MMHSQQNPTTPFIDLNLELQKHLQIEIPDFPFLYPDANSYQVLHFQPEGTVRIRTDFIGRSERDIAQNQCRDFLRLAREKQIDLAIMPEYSCPLEILQEALLADQAPVAGKLWILGGEGITIEKLRAFKADLSAQANVWYNDEIEAAQGDFVDPVFLVFRTNNDNGAKRIVVVVQFKTTPMGDHKRFENDHMRRGSKIYVFNKSKNDRIRLATFICSDALSNHFGNEDTIKQIYGRSLLVHIQLNPNPRHPTFRQYREIFFSRLASDSTELICVNWSNRVAADPSDAFTWGRLGGSALYMKSSHVEGDDTRVNENHRLGLYPTFSDTFRAYCFYFNYLPGVYNYRTSKPCQDNSTPPQARRNGPEMVANLAWDGDAAQWKERQEPMQDDFKRVCGEVDANKLSFLHSPTYDPLNTERLLNLSSGKCTLEGWSELRRLPSCQVREEELIGRLTFAQEPDDGVRIGRRQYFQDLCHLIKMLTDRSSAPKWLEVFSVNAKPSYQAIRPHRNLHDRQFSATAVYAGELHTDDELRKIHADLYKLLVVTDQDTNMLSVWFRRDDSYRLLYHNRRPQANRDRTELPTDIDRDSQIA